MTEPQEEKFTIKHCNFCDEDPKEPGHHRVERVPVTCANGTVVIHLMLTCLNKYPEAMERGKSLQDLMPYTFMLIEEIIAPAPFGGKENWEFMQSMSHRLGGKKDEN